ncbi:hypothetical protein GCM10025880_24080 [Methylorubrum aminovorans]|nr:hypothetical protein GCM10025880_24080 [Methylorubrum aminovorans]
MHGVADDGVPPAQAPLLGVVEIAAAARRNDADDVVHHRRGTYGPVAVGQFHFDIEGGGRAEQAGAEDQRRREPLPLADRHESEADRHRDRQHGAAVLRGGQHRAEADEGDPARPDPDEADKRQDDGAGQVGREFARPRREEGHVAEDERDDRERDGVAREPAEHPQQRTELPRIVEQQGDQHEGVAGIERDRPVAQGIDPVFAQTRERPQQHPAHQRGGAERGRGGEPGGEVEARARQDHGKQPQQEQQLAGIERRQAEIGEALAEDHVSGERDAERGQEQVRQPALPRQSVDGRRRRHQHSPVESRPSAAARRPVHGSCCGRTSCEEKSCGQGAS